MNLQLELKRNDGEIVDAQLKTLDISYIPKIMELQENVIEGLEDKQLFASSSEDEFRLYIEKLGKVIGCITSDGDLIAMGVYGKLGYNNGNYGYDVDLKGEELLSVGQIESTIVRSDYRGNKLQKIICNILENIGKESGTPIMAATVSPYNEFSLNTFTCLGYKVVKDKLKYGGLRRYILVKEL